jgi:hypothetical protein
MTRVETSVPISAVLLRELALYNRNGNITELVEQAATHYLSTLKKQERANRDGEFMSYMRQQAAHILRLATFFLKVDKNH